MKTARDVIKKKQLKPLTISQDATIQAALWVMSNKSMTALPVTKNDAIVGVVSKRDYLRKVSSKKIPAWSVKVNDVMTKDIITIDIDSSIKKCMELMKTNKIHHLVVKEKEKLVSVISIYNIFSLLPPK